VQFFEPAGIAVAGDEAFVADTNNHRIVRLDLKTGAWKELVIEGLAAPGSAEVLVARGETEVRAAVAAGKGVTLEMKVSLPLGAHLTEGAPVSVKVTDGKRVLFTGSVAGVLPLRAVVPAEALAGRPGELHVMVYYTHCMDGINAVCAPAEAAWRVGVSYEGSQSGISLEE
jgi:hypothetical protein